MSIIPLFSCIALLALFTTIVSGNKCYAVEPSISLSIAESSISNTGVVGEEITISNNVTVEGTLINSYNLQISGSPTLEGNSTINSISSDKPTLDDNEWGYKWDNTGNYKGISTTPITIITNTGLDSNGSISYTKPLTFSAKFSDQAEAGHYRTEVNLLLTATPKTLVTYTLSYNGNGDGDEVTNIPETQVGNSYELEYSFIIPDTIPVRVGYKFLGWKVTSNSSRLHQPGDEYIMRAEEDEVKEDGAGVYWYLYAAWEQDGPSVTGFGGIRKMQDMTSSICNSVSNGTTGQLYDTRDNSTYTVGKFGDGKCWMTQNLQLMGSRTLTSSDSNVNSDFSLPDSSIYGFSSNTASNVYLGTDINGTATGFYSWCAATAGTCSRATSTGIYAVSSICPKGWRLPNGCDDITCGKEFYNLFNNMGLGITLSISSSTSWSRTQLNIVQNSIYNFAYTGYVSKSTYNSPSNSQDSSGYWWSGVASGSTGAYLLYYTANYLWPGNNGFDRHYGYAIRCIAQ